ncbi:MAG TPA: TadE family protein, partial [Acidimicrobiales bacterium]|nr:TadE family protein [Acidimicrobiales bacterium]
MESPKRCRGDAGTALVELALIITPLCMLLFGIVIYGYLMSFRQNMTQAATEGARAGAVAPVGTASTIALNATNNALHSFGETCGSGGYTCDVQVATCPTAGSTSQCVTV